MLTAVANGTSKNNPQNWIKSKDYFTADEVFDAFMKGKQEGLDENRRLLLKGFNENIDKAKDVAQSVFVEINKRNVECKSLWLRFESYSSFCVLLLIKPEDFFDDKIDSIYEFLIKKELELKAEDFDISFSMMEDSENLNTKRLNSDNFLLNYGI